MKCLSVSQPYADLIISGKKTIELRTWNTKFRGEFLIHAPIKIKDSACERLGIEKSSLRTGVIIGKAEIYDVKSYESIKDLKNDYNKHFTTEEFLRHRYGFLLRKPQALRVPIPYKGRLGFFEVSMRAGLPSNNDIKSELFDEEYRYQWIGKH
ncbi:MAG: ASCH domain-containing protein [Thaumarchaeota archaeon]|nr:ASCH domain-containing protein [Nitrososphaerota archaeon]MDE1875780.1 ASCH domain-containing protein [Nitrososphaerota archaeon]